jgi:hypothetical protein
MKLVLQTFLHTWEYSFVIGNAELSNKSASYTANQNMLVIESDILFVNISIQVEVCFIGEPCDI